MARFYVYYRVGDAPESVSIERGDELTATQVARQIMDNEVPDLWIAAGALVSVEQR